MFQEIFNQIPDSLKDIAREIDCSDLPDKVKLKRLLAEYLALLGENYVVLATSTGFACGSIFGPFPTEDRCNQWIAKQRIVGDSVSYTVKRLYGS